jgi:hypothetical protein
MRVVAIEEHHIIPEMRSRMDLSLLPPAFRARLHATVGERLADMDAAGIDVQVLSVMLPMPPDAARRDRCAAGRQDQRGTARHGHRASGPVSPPSPCSRSPCQTRPRMNWSGPSANWASPAR